MNATSGRRTGTALLSAVLLAGILAASAMPVGADDDEDGSGIGMDALAGLGADGGGGATSDAAGTGDLNDPLGGGSGSSTEGTETETTGAEPGAADGTDPGAASASTANPMFRLMLDLILDDVQAAEAEAQAAGRPLTQAQRSAVAAKSVKDLIAFLQESGLLGDVDRSQLLQQIEAIPTEPEE